MPRAGSFWGWASDRIGRERAMIIAFVMQAIALLLVLGIGQASAGWFAFTLVLVTSPGVRSTRSSRRMLGDYFGARHATSNYGVLYSAKGAASIVGGGLAALLFEPLRHLVGSFYGSAALALIAAVLAVGLRAAGAPVKRLSTVVTAAS